MRKLAIIIPAHNEEKRIENTLLGYLGYFENLEKAGKLDFTIIVVLNACSDRTEEIVKKYKRNVLVLNFKKGGKGFAVIEGFKYAIEKKFDIIGFVDADMATGPKDFFDLLKDMRGSDGAIASRYLKESKVYPRNTVSRIIASRIYNAAIRAILLLPYRDTQCGAKVFTSDALKDVIYDIGMTQWAFDIELLYKLRKKGFVIKETPIAWSNKEYSKINFWKSGPWMFFAVLRLRLLNSPVKFIVRLYDKVLWKFHKTFMGKRVV